MKTICIMCPMGCPLDVERVDGKVVVQGNTCKRGELYGEQEFVAPKRIVTSLVRLTTGGVVSVKTDELILKTDIAKVLAAIKEITFAPPCKIGDVVAENISGSGANLVITSNVMAK